MEQDLANAAQPKARRRWYQFGLRTLLIGVTLAGCGFGWLGIKVQNSRQQAAVVAAIRKLGGDVLYDYQLNSDGVLDRAATPPGPAWLRAVIGDEFFMDVREVDLASTPTTDADLPLLARFPALEQLWLDGTRISGTGLKDLKGLTKLTSLSLTGASISDAGLAELTANTQLETLSLNGTKVTDRGLEHLKRLPHLKALGLNDTQISDVGLEHLESLPQLESLVLGNTKVTEQGVKNLQQALPNCKIDKDGVSAL